MKFLSDHSGSSLPYFLLISLTQSLKTSSVSGGAIPSCSASHSGLSTQTPSAADLLLKSVFKFQSLRIF